MKCTALILTVALFSACRAEKAEPWPAKPATQTQAPSASASASALPAIDGNATNFFAPGVLMILAPEERTAFMRYLVESETMRVFDRSKIESELKAVGKQEMERAPYGKGFKLEPFMNAAWFSGAEGKRYTDNLLSFQTPSGGWSKRVEFKDGPRRTGQSYYSENAGFHYIATIDNDSTTSELEFLAGAIAARKEGRLIEAFTRGIDYLLSAQLPSGCWPQVFPLQGGYHDAATFNDNATVNVLKLLGSVARGDFAFSPADRKERAGPAVARGLACIVKSQVVVNGKRTVWGQQHDPVSLEPVAARSYELVGLSGRESAWITEYLMSLPQPDAAIVEAVHAAVEWFQAHSIQGYTYNDQVLEEADGAPPLWARLYEIGTYRPIFSNRDGKKRYDWNELTDRRKGYAWYSQEPASVIAKYPTWAAAHPRAGK